MRSNESCFDPFAADPIQHDVDPDAGAGAFNQGSGEFIADLA